MGSVSPSCHSASYVAFGAFASVRSERNAFPKNRHFFAEYKDLIKKPAAAAMQIHAVNPHELRVHLQAPKDAYVYFAHLLSPHETARFSDNYIDLEPSESRELIVRDPTRNLTPESIRLG